MNLKKILGTFEFEFAQNSNFPLRNDLNRTIDKLGKELFRKGHLKNELVLDFISFNEIYCSNKKDRVNNSTFMKKYNGDYKRRKNIDILKTIDINSKSSPIIERINEYKTYDYFYDDMGKEYLKVFTNKLSDIKNLGVFFIVLPKNKYNYDSLMALKEWIEKNINTFSEEQCNT